MTPLTCLAIDDEPLALSYVCGHINQTPFLHLVGSFSNALDALSCLRHQAIDLLFLDIDMPELTGLEFARVLERSTTEEGRPRVVFTTAFSQYALEGYKVDALDYLLKPFSYEEFLRVALKARAYFDRLRQPAALPAPAPEAPSTLILKVEHQLVKVQLDDILFIEGLRDYVRVHRRHESKPLLSLTSLRSLEERLPESTFMRVHRSFIVNLNCINAVSRQSVQIGETHIPVSSQYKDRFAEFLKTWLV